MISRGQHLVHIRDGWSCEQSAVVAWVNFVTLPFALRRCCRSCFKFSIRGHAFISPDQALGWRLNQYFLGQVRLFGRFKAFLLASGRASHSSRPLDGAIWVLIAMAFLAGLVTLGRYLALEGLHPNQVLFFRNLFCVMFMMPMFAVRGMDLVRTQNLKLYGARVVLSFVSMMGMFHAVALIPVGEVTAIGFF